MASAVDSGDNDGAGWPLVALALGGLAAVVAGARYLNRRAKRRTFAARWWARRAALLDDALQAHDGAADLVSRWAWYAPEQLRVAWSTEMAGLARLRSRLSGLLASAPVGEEAADVQKVTTASDDLHLALGHADIGRAVLPPPETIGAAEALDRAIDEAQNGAPPPDPHAWPQPVAVPDATAPGAAAPEAASEPLLDAVPNAASEPASDAAPVPIGPVSTAAEPAGD